MANHRNEYFETKKDLEDAKQHLKDHPDSDAYRHDVEKATKKAREEGHRV